MQFLILNFFPLTFFSINGKIVEKLFYFFFLINPSWEAKVFYVQYYKKQATVIPLVIPYITLKDSAVYEGNNQRKEVDTHCIHER